MAQHNRKLRQSSACSIITVLAESRCSGRTSHFVSLKRRIIQSNGIVFAATFSTSCQLRTMRRSLGFDNLKTDPFDGFVSNPLVSDVQDEPLAERLQARGLPKRDAQHLAQAISNRADVFLTWDERHFINKREPLERQLQNQDSASIGSTVGNRSGSLSARVCLASNILDNKFDNNRA